MRVINEMETNEILIFDEPPKFLESTLNYPIFSLRNFQPLMRLQNVVFH